MSNVPSGRLDVNSECFYPRASPRSTRCLLYEKYTYKLQGRWFAFIGTTAHTVSSKWVRRSFKDPFVVLCMSKTKKNKLVQVQSKHIRSRGATVVRDRYNAAVTTYTFLREVTRLRYDKKATYGKWFATFKGRNACSKEPIISEWVYKTFPKAFVLRCRESHGNFVDVPAGLRLCQRKNGCPRRTLK